MAISLAELARAGEILTGWHVDSVAGDDAADGSAGHPLKTIAGLLAKDIDVGANIWLKRGSYWREMIAISLGDVPNGVKIRAYGTGAAPVLDGADVVTGWTKTPGYTNIYQADVPLDYHGGSYPSTFLRVWEDGYTEDELLTWVGDLATLDATPGAWFGPKTPIADPTTIYIHASDSGDPASNGSVYECAVRQHGIDGGHYPTDVSKVTVIDGISARRYTGHDGGIISTTLLRNCTVDKGGMIATGGGSAEPAHGMWNNGIAEDCTASSFISYGADIPSVAFHRCHATGANAGTGTGFFFHTGAPGQYRFGRYLLEDCITERCAAFAAGDAADIVIVIRPVTSGASGLMSYNSVGRFFLVGGTFVQLTELGNVVYLAGVDEATIFGVRAVVKQRANYASFVAHTGCGKLTFDGNTLVFTDPEVYAGYRSGVAAIGASTQLVAHHNLFRNCAQAVAALGACDADYNVYDSGTTPWVDAGEAFATFAAWQAHGQDAHSVVEDTAFAGDVTTGDTEPAEGAAAWTVEAGADAYGDAHLAEVIAALP